jgi:hypothetical protein
MMTDAAAFMGSQLACVNAGSTVQTKHGNVNTDHILFICSGAFHSCKPSDLMAELQVDDVRGSLVPMMLLLMQHYQNMPFWMTTLVCYLSGPPAYPC